LRKILCWEEGKGGGKKKRVGDPIIGVGKKNPCLKMEKEGGWTIEILLFGD